MAVFLAKIFLRMACITIIKRHMAAFLFTIYLRADSLQIVSEIRQREIRQCFSQQINFALPPSQVLSEIWQRFLFTIYLRIDSLQEVCEMRQCYPLQFTFALNTSEYITSIQRYKAALIFTIYHRIDLITSVQSEKAV